MFTFLKSRSAKAISAAVLSLNLGLGLASPSFGHTDYGINADFGQPAPDQGGELTFESLGAMLKSLDLAYNEVEQNGVVQCQVNIPAMHGNPEVTIMLAISPNKRYLNIWYVVAQLNQQNAPSQQALLAMLQADAATCPSYITIVNNLVLLDDNIRATQLNTDELREQLKEFYAAIQKARSVYTAPAESEPAPAPTPAPAPPANPFQ